MRTQLPASQLIKRAVAGRASARVAMVATAKAIQTPALRKIVAI